MPVELPTGVSPGWELNDNEDESELKSVFDRQALVSICHTEFSVTIHQLCGASVAAPM